MTSEQHEVIEAIIACIDEGEKVRENGLPDEAEFMGQKMENQLFIPVVLLKRFRKAFHGR